MSKDEEVDMKEVDMKDVELNELNEEKQPMTGAEAGNSDSISPTGTEKNGCVKVKIPEKAQSKFTGLTKEELLKVAGTPGWVRTRWALLVLFWLGWLGMLAGAIVIIIQAPRCKELPAMNWWNKGQLYQIGNVAAYAENLKGLAEKMESLSQLKVKGLVLGPIHVTKADDPAELNFVEIAKEAGTLDEFRHLIKIAQKKGVSVVLDLTPNYKGGQPWFANGSLTDVAEKLKPALFFWFQEGVDGVQLSGIERVVSVTPSQWADIRTIMQNTTEEKKRVLFGVTDKKSAVEVSSLLNSSGVDLLVSGVLRTSATGGERAQVLQHLNSAKTQLSLGWSLGDRVQGHLASVGGRQLLKLNQMLLFTLPGTPVFNYGDEIGLEDEQESKFPKMLWDWEEPAKETNDTTKAEKEEMKSINQFFRTLADLRGKERSLLHGDFLLLHNSSSSLAYVREWDQSMRYLAAFNWGAEPTALSLAHPALPARATVTLSTNTALTGEISLGQLELGPAQAVLLQFPYVT
ncbi:hypothetical protein AAFF_G00247430 [Aldrovandia affinis]|uniref:Glycosyl hydrolase family 13 catalytic domain-containing protein n=1 Tax=Aldrovandia affinis TaxID=143900 RepID=A0AAD7SUL4_9TELE|nr:hypothetical protein AAFF_G00247430 [Aldrovandia affinis]